MEEKKQEIHLNSLMTKLKTDVTLTAPAWAFGVAAVVVLVLLGVALD
jgi:hypothetical protein